MGVLSSCETLAVKLRRMFSEMDESFFSIVQASTM